MAEANAQGSLLPSEIQLEGNSLEALLNKEFKPKTSNANAAIQQAVLTLAEQALAGVATISDDAVKSIESMIAAIDKAIRASDLNLNPVADSDQVRLPIPPLTQDRRKDLVKVAKRLTEEARIAIRNVRREANEMVKTLQKASTITEDERDQGVEEVQKLTDTYTKKVDDLLTAREKDIMAV